MATRISSASLELAKKLEIPLSDIYRATNGDLCHNGFTADQLRQTASACDGHIASLLEALEKDGYRAQ